MRKQSEQKELKKFGTTEPDSDLGESDSEFTKQEFEKALKQATGSSIGSRLLNLAKKSQEHRVLGPAPVKSELVFVQVVLKVPVGNGVIDPRTPFLNRLQNRQACKCGIAST